MPPSSAANRFFTSMNSEVLAETSRHAANANLTAVLTQTVIDIEHIPVSQKGG
jgi:hypothetical protein